MTIVTLPNSKFFQDIHVPSQNMLYAYLSSIHKSCINSTICFLLRLYRTHFSFGLTPTPFPLFTNSCSLYPQYYLRSLRAFTLSFILPFTSMNVLKMLSKMFFNVHDIYIMLKIIILSIRELPKNTLLLPIVL